MPSALSRDGISCFCEATASATASHPSDREERREEEWKRGVAERDRYLELERGVREGNEAAMHAKRGVREGNEAAMHAKRGVREGNEAAMHAKRIVREVENATEAAREEFAVSRRASERGFDYLASPES